MGPVCAKLALQEIMLHMLCSPPLLDAPDIRYSVTYSSRVLYKPQIPCKFCNNCFFLCCPGCNDWYEPQRQLCGWRGTEQKKNPDSQVPHWARYCYQLGWHGDVLASHVLQWAESFPWGPPSPPHRGPPEPQDKQGKDGTGNEGWHQFPPTPSTYLKLFFFFCLCRCFGFLSLHCDASEMMSCSMGAAVYKLDSSDLSWSRKQMLNYTGVCVK